MSEAMTRAEIMAKRCCRCRRRGFALWDVCADAHRPRVICQWCDVALNRLVLRWMKDRHWKQKAKRYRAYVSDKAMVLGYV